MLREKQPLQHDAGESFYVAVVLTLLSDLCFASLHFVLGESVPCWLPLAYLQIFAATVRLYVIHLHDSGFCL